MIKSTNKNLLVLIKLMSIVDPHFHPGFPAKQCGWVLMKVCDGGLHRLIRELAGETGRKALDICGSAVVAET